MNITPHVNTTPIATVVNPPTDSLRRENNHRQVITPPAAPSGSAAEKGVADKDKGKTPAQSNEQFDFADLRKKAEQNDGRINENSEQGSERNPDQKDDQSSDEKKANSGDETSPEKSGIEVFAETKEIKQLQQRDREVRSHELAHASVGGASTGAPSYEFQVGPDGKKYAVGGEVSVDLATVDGNPRATIAKMQKVHAAALAPANPSVQDTRVAAKATEIINQAQSELIALELEASEVQTQSKNSPYIDSSDVFQEGGSSEKQSKSFDQQINEILQSQESISPSRTNDVTERASRVQGFYSNITEAYEKPPSHQFQLTA